MALAYAYAISAGVAMGLGQGPVMNEEDVRKGIEDIQARFGYGKVSNDRIMSLIRAYTTAKEGQAKAWEKRYWDEDTAHTNTIHRKNPFNLLEAEADTKLYTEDEVKAREEAALNTPLGKTLGKVVGVSIVEMLKEGRWFTNWRTMDDRDKWTADDFHLLKYPDDLGHIASMSADIVMAIKAKVESELQARIAEADRATLETIASLLNGDSNQLEVIGMYIRNKLTVMNGRLAEVVTEKVEVYPGHWHPAHLAVWTKYRETLGMCQGSLDGIYWVNLHLTKDWDEVQE